MTSLEQISFEQLNTIVAEHNVTLPIEQTAEWSKFQATIPGRTPWRTLAIKNNGDVLAVISLVDYTTHGYHYLRASHGPVYMTSGEATPSAQLQSQVTSAIVDYVKKSDSSALFIRMNSSAELNSFPTLSMVPYNQTVVIDVTGGDEEILSRMKRRGRRDVRKSIRECKADCSEETQRAIKDFSEYYAIMVETGKRDGFVPSPMSDYVDMITNLGADHCRVFAARLDDEVIAWSIVTVNGNHAVRYYAAMGNNARRMHVTDRLLYAECCILGEQGITEYDLMGIGNDFAPSLKGLNEFKTKFTEAITDIAPERDFAVKPLAYKVLRTIQRIRKSLRKSSGK